MTCGKAGRGEAEAGYHHFPPFDHAISAYVASKEMGLTTEALAIDVAYRRLVSSFSTTPRVLLSQVVARCGTLPSSSGSLGFSFHVC